MQNLKKFGNIVIDLNLFMALTPDNYIVFTNGQKEGIDSESADALRELFSPKSKEQK